MLRIQKAMLRQELLNQCLHDDVAGRPEAAKGDELANSTRSRTEQSIKDKWQRSLGPSEVVVDGGWSVKEMQERQKQGRMHVGGVVDRAGTVTSFTDINKLGYHLGLIIGYHSHNYGDTSRFFMELSSCASSHNPPISIRFCSPPQLLSVPLCRFQLHQ